VTALGYPVRPLRSVNDLKIVGLGRFSLVNDLKMDLDQFTFRKLLKPKPVPFNLTQEN